MHFSKVPANFILAPTPHYFSPATQASRNRQLLRRKQRCHRLHGLLLLQTLLDPLQTEEVLTLPLLQRHLDVPNRILYPRNDNVLQTIHSPLRSSYRLSQSTNRSFRRRKLNHILNSLRHQTHSLIQLRRGPQHTVWITFQRSNFHRSMRNRHTNHISRRRFHIKSILNSQARLSQTLETHQHLSLSKPTIRLRKNILSPLPQSADLTSELEELDHQSIQLLPQQIASPLSNPMPLPKSDQLHPSRCGAADDLAMNLEASLRASYDRRHRFITIFWMPLLDSLGINPLQLGLRKCAQKTPSKIECSINVPILIDSLADEPPLEVLGKGEVQLIPGRQCFLADNRNKVSEAPTLRVSIVQLIRNLSMILSRPALPNTLLHQARQRWRRINRWIDPFPVQTSIDENLPLSNVAGKVRNRMRHVIMWHCQYGHLCDRAFGSVKSTRSFVYRGQIRVHVSRIPSPTRDLFPGRRDLPQRLSIICHIRQYDQHMHTKSHRKIFRSSQRKPRSQDALDRRIVGKIDEHRHMIESSLLLKILPEEASLISSNAHSGKDSGEGFLGSLHPSLTGDLRRDHIMRQPSTREKRQFLPPNKSIHAVNGRDSSLDELARVFPSERVDR